MPPRETLWPITPETAAKHQVLRTYLNAWFPIMGRRGGRLVVIDGFAGPGRYEGGEPGSPLIMLDALRTHSARASITAEVVFLFIEEKARRAAHLKGEVDAVKNLPGMEGVTVEIARGRYHEELQPLLDDIDARGASLAPTFAFIDPFGYASTRLELAGRILGFKRCEVLIYVPLPFIARFVAGDDPPEDAITHLFGDDRWRAAQSESTQDGRERALHDLLIDRLREECEFVRSFEIVGSGPNNGATLFFGTNNRLGLSKMKSAMWKVDPVEGQAFQDSTDGGQITLFQPTPDFGQLESQMRDHFGTRPFTIEDAVDFTLVGTGFAEEHVKTKTLRPAENGGRLVCLSSRAKRLTYPAGTRLRFAAP